MSEKAPHGAYVYQPDPPSKKTNRIYAVGGLPLRYTKEEARAVAEAINDICWVDDQCLACGHEFSFSSTHCQRCSKKVSPPWEVPCSPS